MSHAGARILQAERDPVILMDIVENPARRRLRRSESWETELMLLVP